jgi:hypothetical protein
MYMIRRRKILGLLALAAAVVFAVGAFCARAGADTMSDQWQFNAFIYGYFPQLGGTATFPSGQSVDITVDAKQVISNLKFAAMGSFSAQKGPLGAFVDLIYADVSGSKSGTRSFSLGNNLMVPSDVNANLNLDVRSTIWTFGGYYRLVQSPEAVFDVAVGGRELVLKQDLGYQFSADIGPFSGPGRQGSLGTNGTNWDAIVGAKGQVAFGDNHAWFIPYYFDVGAGQSHLTWQALGGLGYKFSWGDIIGLWRYIDWKFSKDDASFSMNGPAIGVAFHW